jgi:hypothetical protein
MRNIMSASNNKNMKWVHITYNRIIMQRNTGKFLTSLDPKMVERWLYELERTSELSDSDVERITQSQDWEEITSPPHLERGYRGQNQIEFVIDEKMFGEGEMDDEIQSWIDTKRVDITSIYATGHDPLEIQDFIEEHQEIFNKMVTRKTIYDLKNDEGNLYCSLRKLVGLENPEEVGSGRNTFSSNSVIYIQGFYSQWKEKKEVHETCEVS